MRLWHRKLIQYLDNKRLAGQHRECCALRGKGWGKKHATVDYAFKHSPMLLYAFHQEVIAEMTKRGYWHDSRWDDPLYRGAYCDPWPESVAKDIATPYPEHDDAYLRACIARLDEKCADTSKMKEELLKEKDI